MSKTGLKFGVASIPLSTVKSNYLNGLERIFELGLDAFELPFGQFINMSEESAKAFKIRKEELEIKYNKPFALSVHAPYYVNLNAKEEIKREESIQRVIKAAIRGSIAGATNIVFHPGFYLDYTKDEAYKRVKESIERMLNEYESNFEDPNRAMLRIETTGKPNQFGDIEELIKIAKEENRILPCIDFAHLHARSNGINNDLDAFRRILDQLNKGLGDRALQDMHIHYSGIEYSEKGERKHLPLEESDAAYLDLMKAFKEFNIAGEVICESPALENDAIIMRDAYLSF